MAKWIVLLVIDFMMSGLDITVVRNVALGCRR